ncbi:MAG: beta-ketoacyl-ACP synthase III [bacterium]
MNASIIGIGSYLPERILTNADLEKMVDTTDEWIYTRTGIRQRRIAADSEAVSDMAAVAARRAMEDAGLQATDIGMIIVATSTPDMFFPSSACLVQGMIGAVNSFCFDMEAACSGFLYALETGRRYVEAGTVRNALIIGAEKFSCITDWTDRDTCVLFGDGAGAVVLSSAGKGRGMIATVMRSDGRLADVLRVEGAGSRKQPAAGVGEAMKQPRIRMNGREVFKHAVLNMTSAVQEVLAKSGIGAGEIDWVVPHQANTRIIGSVNEKLGIPMEKCCLNLERVGNISAASVPVAMDEAVKDGRIRRGQKVLTVVAGAGFTWGASVLEW